MKISLRTAVTPVNAESTSPGDVVRSTTYPNKVYLHVQGGKYARICCSEASVPVLDLPSLKPHGLSKRAKVEIIGRLEIDMEE